MNPTLRTIALCLLCIRQSCVLGQYDDLTANLVADGGLEEWRETAPTDSWWNYLTVTNKGLVLTRDEKANLLTPKLLPEFLGCQVMQPEEKDVHSGRKALRLKCQFYLTPVSPEVYDTKEGDVYIVRYWAKGEGQTLMHMHIYGDTIAQILEVKGKPDKNRRGCGHPKKC